MNNMPDWFDKDDWSYLATDDVSGCIKYELEYTFSSLCEEGDHYIAEFYPNNVVRVLYGHSTDIGYREIDPSFIGSMKPANS